MTYSVKEIFFTLQGEGYHTARPAVFLRFAGCNLWTGLEADRATAICQFCDTDFVGTNGPGGGKFRSAESLAAAVAACWQDPPPDMLRLRQQIVGTASPDEVHQPYVVCTGGEPLLQLDAPLIAALHAQGFEIAIETNGTLAAPPGIDWICVSPKAGAELVQRSGQELKVVVPQDGLDLDALAALPFEHHFLQAMDGPDLQRNTQWAIARCLQDPRWRLSVQTHKVLDIR